MHPIRTATALAGTLACLLLTAAAPTPAPAPSAGPAPHTRSSSGCTHNWNGPQVCIEIHGHDDWADRVTVRWTDPGPDTTRAVAVLHEGDEQREVHIRATGHRQGKEIVAEWTQIQLAWGKVCGSFDGLGNVWACQDVYSTGRY